MRKAPLVCVALVLALIVQGRGSVFSQEAPALTLDQQEQFDSQKFTVTGYRILTVSRFGTSDSGFGPSSRNWEVSRGYDKVSESDFLKTLGLDKEALEAQSHQTLKSSLTVGGALATVVGLGLILWPVISPPHTTDAYGYQTIDTNASMTMMGVGLGVGLGGAVMIAIGGNMAPNVTPYGRAQALADKYNAELLIRITGGDKPVPRPADNGST